VELYQEDNSTLCFFINPKSGGGNGKKILKLLKRDSNSQYILFNLEELRGLMKYDEMWNKIRETLRIPSIRIVIGGGDGSFSSVLSILDLCEIPKPYPPIGILPLGVGNDISRCIGWNNYFNLPFYKSTKKALKHQIIEFKFGTVIKLDRWEVTYYKADVETENRSIVDSNLMNAFFSIGLDAQIAYKFEDLRKKQPFITSSRLIELWYAIFGVEQFMFPFPKVRSFVELIVDGIQIKLPSNIRSIQILNIHSSNGVDFFGTKSSGSNSDLLKNYVSPSLNDRLLEVVGTKGVFHLLKTKINLSHSVRLAQGREIYLKLYSRRSASDAQTHLIQDESVPAQLDGETFLLQIPLNIHIKLYDQINVIQGPNATRCVIPHTT